MYIFRINLIFITILISTAVFGTTYYEKDGRVYYVGDRGDDGYELPFQDRAIGVPTAVYKDTIYTAGDIGRYGDYAFYASASSSDRPPKSFKHSPFYESFARLAKELRYIFPDTMFTEYWPDFLQWAGLKTEIQIDPFEARIAYAYYIRARKYYEANFNSRRTEGDVAAKKYSQNAMLQFRFQDGDSIITYRPPLIDRIYLNYNIKLREYANSYAGGTRPLYADFSGNSYEAVHGFMRILNLTDEEVRIVLNNPGTRSSFNKFVSQMRVKNPNLPVVSCLHLLN